MPDLSISESPEWQELEEHADEIGGVHLRDLFAADPGRAERMTVSAGDLVLDYSKQRVSGETMRLLVALATRAGLAERRAAMFAGSHINVTEDRAVLHVALRMPSDVSLVVDGQDVVADVHQVLDHMGTVSDSIRSGAWVGATGRRIRTVINIGIGGSDLGPSMAYEALKDFCDPELSCRFVSNVDPTDLYSKTHDLDPAETLFVVSSKTFTTLETLTNAAAAREWLLAGLPGGAGGGRSGGAGGGGAGGGGAGGGGAGGDSSGAVAKHFVAVSTNTAGVTEFGIDPANMFGFWDWVGGRYSFDSAIGFSLMVAIGKERFLEMLAGMREIDLHFCSAPLAANMPVIQGLVSVWYNNFLGAQSHAVLPYSQRLARFPAYLQQLTMESNGKSVRLDGSTVDYQTGEVYWGEPGTNGQHAFYQLLHQGTKLIPADFIAIAEAAHDIGSQQDLLVANCLAQSAVLAFGRTAAEVAAEGTPAQVVPHKVMPGNRPSSTILAPRLTPSVLGQLVALYEHSVFTAGVIWGIDSFDQWGVELGKVMANELFPVLTAASSPDLSGHDASTAELVRRYRVLRGRPG